MDRIDEIRMRLADISAGDWRVCDDDDTLVVIEDEDGDDQPIACQCFTEDAAFIANAPADVAFLIAEIDRLRAFERAATAMDDLTRTRRMRRRRYD